MPKLRKYSTAANHTGATIGYEARLWQMADAPRGSMDAAEYKHIVIHETLGWWHDMRFWRANTARRRIQH